MKASTTTADNDFMTALLLRGKQFISPGLLAIWDLLPSLKCGEDRSRPGVVGIRIEQLLAVDLIAGNVFLALRGDQVIDELLAEILLHIRMLGRVHQDHAILVEQALVAFDLDDEIALVLEGNPRPAVGQSVGAHAGGRIE